MNLEQIIKQTHKSYYPVAKINLDGNKLTNRNTATNILHPFSDGREVITISQSQKVIVNEILKKL
jgi:hypothetical protein